MGVGPVGLLRRRARSRAGVLTVLALLVATIAGVGGAVVVAAGRSATGTARDVLADASGARAVLVVRTRLAADPAAQHERLAEALRERVGDVPLAVSRALVSEPQRVVGTRERVVLRSVDDTRDVAAALPAEGEVLVADDVAAALGLAAGDRLALQDGGAQVRTVPDDVPGQVLGDAAGAQAVGEPGVHGPLLVTESTLLEVVEAPFVEWTVAPVVDEVRVGDLAPLAEAGRGLEPALTRVDGLAERGLTVDGDLPATADHAAHAAATVRTTGLVPVVLLALVAAVAVGQVVRLLVTARVGEVGVLVGRGADPARVVRWAAVEAAVVAGLGAVAGSLVALVVAGGGRPSAAVPAVASTALATAAVAVAVTAWTTARQVRAFVRAGGTARRTRLRSLATAGSLVGAPLVAVLTSWRLLRTDGLSAAGTSSADLLAVAAPAAVLVALAVGGLVLLVPVARVGEAVTARRPRLAATYVARQVARRPSEHAAAVVLLVLAVGTVSVTAAFGASVARHRDDLAALETGADVRVALPDRAAGPGPDAAAVASGPYADLPGVAAAGTVLRTRATVADGEVAVTALDAARATDVVRAPVDLGGLATALTGAPDGSAPARPALPDDATALELTLRVGLTADPGGVPVTVAAWLADADGALSRVPLGTVTPGAGAAEQAEPAVVRAELPGAGPYRLAALDVDTRSGPGTLTVEVVGVTVVGPAGATDVAGPGTPWVPAPAVAVGVDRAEAVGDLGVRADLAGGPDGGVAPVALRVLAPTADGVPVVVSRGLAERADLAVGDTVRAPLAGPEVVLAVVGVVDAVPGALEDEAVLADLAELGQGLLGTRRTPVAPGEVWLAVDETADAAAVAGAAAALAGAGAQATTATTAAADAAAPVVDGFWTTAATAVLLALTGVAAVAVALLRVRRGEVVVLRAVGQTPAAQARTRAVEHLAVALPAVVVGALAGAATSLVLVPALVRSTVLTSGPLPVRLAADTGTGLALVGVLVIGLAAVAAGTAWRVHGQALDRDHREEVA